MTDIVNSPAVRDAVKQGVEPSAGQTGADASEAANGVQPLRAAVIRAAQLARDAESRARDKQHAKHKKTARERLDLLFDTGTFEEIGRFRAATSTPATPDRP